MERKATSIEQRVNSLLKREGSARSKDLVNAGLSRIDISRRVAAGRLVRLSRGLYALPNYRGSEFDGVVAVAKRVPHAVFCLLTALRIHEMTSQSPFEVWIAIGNKAHPPQMGFPAIRAVRFSQAALHSGIEVRRIDAATVRVTNVAKTVADCFKFRNKVGLEVALEALREAVRSKKTTMDELWRQARVDRVANVMRPYLEAVA